MAWRSLVDVPPCANTRSLVEFTRAQSGFLTGDQLFRRGLRHLPGVRAAEIVAVPKRRDWPIATIPNYQTNVWCWRVNRTSHGHRESDAIDLERNIPGRGKIRKKGPELYVEACIRYPSAMHASSGKGFVVTRNRRNQSEDLALICPRGGGSLELAMERRSLHSRPMRCDHCRRSFGLIIHRFWRMRFCSADCLTAYQRRLDKV
jgi:hypothetical protein